MEADAGHFIVISPAAAETVIPLPTVKLKTVD